MAIIKCKMCGGDLNIIEGASTAECEYCGSRQTVPKVDDEKKLNLFTRANRFRSGCDFDKASGVYESIIADFPEEAEAYWGLVLCKFGIEYVDDPATGKKVPTCHRSGFDSVMKDPNVELAQEYADIMARRLYREEAKAIEEIRKGIIAVSANEEPYDVFICYKETDFNGKRTLDSVLAQDIYDALTDKGYRVFFSRISLEDKLGTEYEPYIFAALNSAKIMLAIGTDFEYFNAVWVKNEWSRFLKLMAQDKSKHLIPCYKGIDAYDMPEEFARLQAQDLDKMGAVQDIVRGVQKLLPKQKETTAVTQQPTANAMVMRGQFSLEDKDWKRADEYFERALDENPQDGSAYLGKVLVALQLSNAAQIDDYFVKIHDNKDFERAIRFSDAATAKQLTKIRDRAHKKYLVKCVTVAVKKHIKQIQQEEERIAREKQEQEARQRKEQEEKERQLASEELKAKRQYTNYNRAIKYLDQGEKEAAYGLLKRLSGYKDADALLESIKNDILTFRACVKYPFIIGYSYINETGTVVTRLVFKEGEDFSHNGLACVKNLGKWGYINETGEMVIKSQFDYARSFDDDGFAPVEQNGKWGYINEAGEMVKKPQIKPRFDCVYDFAANGLARVKVNRKYGYINKAREMVTKPQFDDAGDFAANGLAPVKQNGKWGYINEAGIMVIKPQFDGATGFGLACVKLNDKWGYINKAGEMVIKPQFDDAWPFAANGLACVKQNDKWGYINKAGEMVIKPQFDYAWPFAANGLALVKQNDKYGSINEAGEMVIKPQFDFVYDFNSNGITKVAQNGKYGYINEAGEILIEPRFDFVYDFYSNGITQVEQNGKYGYINEAGEILIEPRFDRIRSFAANGLAQVKQNGKRGYINEAGEILIEPGQFDDIGDFADNGLAPVKQNGKWGYINEAGEMVIPPQFEGTYGFAANGIAEVEQNGKWGYINEAGEMVIKPQFNAARSFAASGFAPVEQNGKWGYINEAGEMVIKPQFSEAGRFAIIFRTKADHAKQIQEAVSNEKEQKKKWAAEQASWRAAGQQASWRAAGVCQHCGGALKGLFSKKCSNCGKAKDY